jgi:cellulose synthase/poly-beta-1,6-N-acetylglucosamine synthase-like glycosyltransferase
LDHLCSQNTTENVKWDTLVVDNNSNDLTKDVVANYMEKWRDDVPLKYAFEERQGKSYALETAVELSDADYIAFLDDDNLPDPDWINSAYHFINSHSNLGAFGGQIHGAFETEPSIHFGLVKPLFAINEESEEKCYSCGKRLELGAPGAGLFVKREAWIESVPGTGLQNKGTMGESRGEVAEDLELQIYLYKNGWDIWHNPNMHMQHKIPESRFEENYLKNFFRAIGLSRHSTRMMLYKGWKKPFATLLYWMKDLRDLLKILWSHRKKIHVDKFVRGRILVTFYMLISPFRIK